MRITVNSPAALVDCATLIAFAGPDGASESAGIALPAADLAARAREQGDFAGKVGETLLLYAEEGGKLRRVLLVGLGPAAERGPATWRRAASSAQKQLAALGVTEACLVLPGDAELGELCSALVLSGYKFDRLISEAAGKARHLERVLLVVEDSEKIAALQAEVDRALIIARGTLKARDLLCAPANELTPGALVDEARCIAAANPDRVACKVLDEAELATAGFDALLAVGRGSVHESHLVVLDYNSAATPTVVLVGKGVTFDSGGISLKPVEKMDEMKYDMGGAAAVLGVFAALAALDLPLRVVGLIPTVENMPGGRAYRPGDVLRSRSGLSIEIMSTDAEGRLILADALDFAKDYSPDLLIDIATLTGSCLVGLGHEAAGMMSNERGAVHQEALQASGDKVGERVWPLPMFPEYAERIKSEVADMKNSGGRYGGAIIAGKFLQRFADHSPWIHLDIAGTAWIDKERDLTPKVGNGFGVRLLLEFLAGYR